MSEEEASEQKVLRVGILDDHQVLVEALRLVIQNQPGMQVAGTAGTCAEGLALTGRERPDVLLLDVALPDGDGIQLVPRLKEASPETSILVLTSLSDEATLLRAIDAGVNGFVAKNRSLSEVLAAIREAASGEIAIPTSLLIGLLSRASQEPRKERRGGDAISGLTITRRELEILQLLAEGKSGKDIADELRIAPLTVRTHIRNLLQKMGARSRLEAVTFAIRQGLIEPPA